jgi:hypothetical protein
MQLVKVIEYILRTRMGMSSLHLKTEGVTRKSYSHFECIYYLFESMDSLYIRLQDVKPAHQARVEIDNCYY